jgi:hypothetical protein
LPSSTAEKAGVPPDTLNLLLAGTHGCDKIEDIQKIGMALELD